jgi:CheY-like chemotaxis protein
VVDDNDVAALQIRTALEDTGYEVAVAAGGAEALECVARTIPDAVVLDLMMPEIDGFQVLEQIRSSEATATLPVLILTAKDVTAEERARLTHNNVQQLIQKGTVDRDRLLECVATLVGKPVESEESTTAPAEPVSQTRVGRAEGSVLVVEDNPDNMLAITALLDEMKCSYDTVTNGHEAIETAKKMKPALILMDVQLPGLSGIDAAEQIKTDPNLAEAPIVALTARAMMGDREQLLAAGFDDYLSKPIEALRLESVLDKWIKRGEA